MKIIWSDLIFFKNDSCRKIAIVFLEKVVFQKNWNRKKLFLMYQFLVISIKRDMLTFFGRKTEI